MSCTLCPWAKAGGNKRRGGSVNPNLHQRSSSIGASSMIREEEQQEREGGRRQEEEEGKDDEEGKGGREQGGEERITPMTSRATDLQEHWPILGPAAPSKFRQMLETAVPIGAQMKA
ncbi:unnamed protein product [Prorocentrum cordatum]|uniref:Uncharacterized protein n=1 Tax=Prorocentrum cordatum TaxID=2364126 RepID=A0ABN9YAT9_9DINO|nr:unnamed protein product [Polarella glacialis]